MLYSKYIVCVSFGLYKKITTPKYNNGEAVLIIQFDCSSVSFSDWIMSIRFYTLNHSRFARNNLVNYSFLRMRIAITPKSEFASEIILVYYLSSLKI